MDLTKEEQKANELIDKFAFVLVDFPFDNTITAATQCAVICVQEIIDCTKGKEGQWNINVQWMNEKFYNHVEFTNFWQSVLSHLQK